MTPEDLKFIEDNWIDFACIPDGYCRHIDHITLGAYEEIYRKYLDKQFVLTKWCGYCVYDMMKRLLEFINETKQ